MSRYAAVRLASFILLILLLALSERLKPRRPLTEARSRRWPANIGISALNSVIYVVSPLVPATAAVVAERMGWGIFHLVPLPYGVRFIATLLFLDLVIYIQHALFHFLPLFWRLHRMHHADIDIDVTTGSRFHPIEIALSLIIKIAAVVFLGAPAAAVLTFEILLNATSMFNHTNVDLPLPLDRVLRLLLVTPDMHRVHHSVMRHETDSNFGFNFPWWDRLCGTYRAQPEEGHLGMTIGLKPYREPMGLMRMLRLPFEGP